MSTYPAFDLKNLPVDNGLFILPAPNDPAWLSGQRHWILPYALVFLIITTTMVIMRIVSRINRSSGKIGFDDVLILFAWALSVAMTGIICYGAFHLGWDRHMMKVPPNIWPYGAKVGGGIKTLLLAAVDHAQYTLIAEFLFMYSILSTKISVLMFYRRLIAGTYSKKFKWSLWAGIAFAIITTVVPMSLLLRQCTPIEAIWRQWDLIYAYSNAYKFHCQKMSVTVLISRLGGAWSVISDFYSVLLPSLLLMNMKLNERQRIGLVVVFGLGYVVVIAGIVRTYYLSEATGPKPDKSWNVFNVWVAAIAEANTGIMCACAPSLKSVFGKFFRDLTTNNTKESSQSPTDNSGAHNTGSSGASGKTDTMGMFFDSRITEDDKFGKTTRSDSAGSCIGKIPFPANRKSGQVAGQELTSFADVHEWGVDSFTAIAEGYDNGSHISIRSHENETPREPAISRYEFGHEDLLNTNPRNLPPTYKDTRMEPGFPLPVQLASGTLGNSAGEERYLTPSFIFIDDQDEQEQVKELKLILDR